MTILIITLALTATGIFLSGGVLKRRRKYRSQRKLFDAVATRDWTLRSENDSRD